MTVSEKWLSRLSILETGIGILAMALAALVGVLLLHRGQASDPHGFIRSFVIGTMLFAIAATVSGVMLRVSAPGWRVISQILICLALCFLYIEWFTGHAGWWEP